MKNGLAACAAILLSFLGFCCQAALAQCSLNIENDIRSGWNKKNVSYTVDKNTLQIKGSEEDINDADSVYIGSIKGCSTLTIHVSQVTGNFSWAGKVIGFSFFNDKLEPHQWGNQASFPRPRGRTIEDGFIKAGMTNNTALVYDLENSAETTYFGAKVFIGQNTALELQFSAQSALREPRFSPQQASRPSQKRYSARTASSSDNPAASCSLSCHEPRTEDREYLYTGDFSIPSRADCPHWSE